MNVDDGAGGGRVVTQADVDLVLESMLRRETGTLRVIGLIAEVLGWVAVVSGALIGAFQWTRFDGREGEFGGSVPWTELAIFVLPTVVNLAVAGVTLVVLGRGARLFGLHQAARRNINVTGLTLGEPLDLDLEDD